MSLDVTKTVASVTTEIIPVNWRQFADTKPDIKGLLTFAGTATAKVEVTLDDPNGASPVWTEDAVFASGTTDVLGVIIGPVRGIRLNCTAWTSGNVVLHVLQG